jgi:two-component system, cell cycle sensor histidine kinase and response regulator CckA
MAVAHRLEAFTQEPGNESKHRGGRRQPGQSPFEDGNMSEPEASLVLVVEDDPVACDLECMMLQRHGMAIRTASTGSDAITLLNKERFSAVVLDYLLPDGVCWPVIEAARKLAVAVPVVVVTGMGDERVAVEAIRHGAVDYIAKSGPMMEKLPEIIQRAIKQFQSEHALEEMNLRLQAAVRASNTGLWDWNVQTNEVVYSREWKSQLGHEEDEVGNHFNEWSDRVHPEDRERTLANITDYLTGAVASYEVEYRLRHKNGTYRWILARGTAIRTADGKPVRMLGSHVDITDLKTAFEQVQLQSAALNAAANSIMITDTQGIILWVNDAFTRLTGYAKADCIGKSPRILKTDKSPPGFYRDMWQTITAGRVWSGQVQNRRKSGEYYLEEMTITPVRDGRNNTTHFIAIKQDITERRKLEDQLRHSQKMEALGMLAGGVAHDFNNLLTIINGRSELLLTRLKSDEKSRSELEQIRRTGGRAAELTRQLLAFSRRQVLESKVVDLNRIVADMEKMIKRLVPENIDLLIVLDPATRSVKVDPGQIEQVIMNLVVNARDAMPKGGKITIETGTAELNEAYCRSHLDVTPGRYTRISLSDNGHGMDAATRGHIFEPFFTTKEQGKGTGLGLSTVFGIVKQSKGHIDVYSEVGRGTTFKIYLPETGGSAAATGARLDFVRGGKESILVVEDEDGVRGLVHDILESNGYSVLLARHGKEALQLCENPSHKIALIITDVIMPEMGGPELIERIRKSYPAIKVIYASGYTDRAIIRNGELPEGVNFLQKPFSPNALLQRVREVLDSPSSGA